MATPDTLKQNIPSSEIPVTEGASFRVEQQPKPQPESIVHSPETEKSSETESQPKPQPENVESAIQSLTQKLRGNKKKKTEIPTIKDEITRRVERVMEEGLGDAYRELTVVQQQEFKIKGEETAWKIRQLLKRGHIKIKEIFKLLVEWLRLLPGINKFFIEQEAKIKADKILALSKHQRFE